MALLSGRGPLGVETAEQRVMAQDGVRVAGRVPETGCLRKRFAIGVPMDFVQRLRHIQRKNNSLLCIGLDTDAMKIPEFLYAYGDPQFEFNRRIIDATKDIVCAYKLNVAFYESAGEHGWYTVHQTLARMPD